MVVVVVVVVVLEGGGFRGVEKHRAGQGAERGDL